MKVANSKEMQAIDRATIREYGITAAVLMERAGLRVAERVREIGGHKVIVLSGGGNNGGDGIVAARDLHNSGYNVKVIMTAKKKELAPGCMVQFDIAGKMGVPIEFRKPRAADFHSATVVDAIFGTGLKRNIEGPVAKVIETVNDSGAPVVAVDIPSGISADTGEVMGIAVRAGCTVTFGLPKRGHLLHPGAEYTGKLFVEDIGFPPTLTGSEKLKCNLLEHKEMALLAPERQAYSHKGDYGHVFVIAGSRGKTGAALMTARACLRTGAGLVTIGVPEHLMGSFQSAVMEEMLLALPDTGAGAVSIKALDKLLRFADAKADVVAIGPGLGTDEETSMLIQEFISRCAVPMVVDADGINALAGKTSMLGRVKAPVIVTPHPGEFSRLTGTDIRDIERDRIGTALGFSKKTGAFLVLKGVPTVVAEPEGSVFINSTGNPGMAKAGVGDALTGIISSLLAQGFNSPLEASLLGVYMHGLAGDIAAGDKGEHSLLSSDIIDAMPGAFNRLQSP